MALPYLVRLFCVCLAAFFLTNLAATVSAWAAVPAALRVSRNARPDFASRLLFGLRMFPVAASSLVVLGLCLPSYLWLEPSISNERVGYDCLVAAALGATLLMIALIRGAASLLRTAIYLKKCAQAGREVNIPEASCPVLIVEDDEPVVAIAGLVRPKLIVSQQVLDNLTPDQRIAAFRHEHAHRASRDNLKRLLLRVAPGALPFLAGFTKLDQRWTEYVEWAADDRAVDGSSERALSLAAALVSVARLGQPRDLPCILSTLVGPDEELRARVDRLLREQHYVDKPMAPLFVALKKLGLASGALLGLVLAWHGSLGAVHQVLEKLIQ